jgi:hypothetical protein
LGGTGTAGVAAEADVLPEIEATLIQCPNVVLVIPLPSTATTELPGTPLPHADNPTRANKMAPSAGMMRKALGTTRAL